jgi:hypothetical protein
MAILAKLWFHFCAASGWFPAALNLFRPAATEDQRPRDHLQLANKRLKTQFDVGCRPRPCSFGRLMLPKLAVPANGRSQPRVPSREFQVQAGLCGINSGQLIAPGAANGSYY